MPSGEVVNQAAPGRSGRISGWLSITPPGSSAGNADCDQRTSCTAGEPIKSFAAGWVHSTWSMLSFGR